jgi:hypothetical protein
MNTMPEGSLVPQQGWWSRHWKWVVGLGCLVPMLSCVCLSAGFLYLGLSSLTKLGAYTEAVAIATSDAEVRRALGTPIDTRLPKQSSVSTHNGRTEARFTVPLDGPLADGDLLVDAQEVGDGEWRYRTLTVVVEDGTRIDLRDDAPAEEREDPPTPPVPPEPPFGAEPPGRGEEAPPREGDSDIEL